MIKSLVKKSLDTFVSKQTNIFSAAFFIILTTIVSDILGILKYRLLVAIFSASNDLGVFLAAFRVPDLLFQVVIAGALSSAFIPVFSDLISKERKEEAHRLTSAIITISLIAYFILSVVIFLFAYQIASLIAPRFSEEQLLLMANLMRIIQLAQAFFILGTIATSVLQSFQHFLIPGIASSFYNIGIIAGLIIFSSSFGIYGAAIGVIIGVLLFLIVQIPLLITTGYRYKPSLVLDINVKKVLNLMGPRSLALLITQISITANIFFASFISPRSVVIFELAERLMIAPVLLFGYSIAQASFPSLAQKKDDKEEFSSIFSSSFTQTLYFVLPVSVLLIVLRIPIVRLTYGASKFDWDATVATGLTLAFLAVSIFAQSLIYLFSRAFYALQEARIPLVITIVAVISNILVYTSYLYIIENPALFSNFLASIKPVITQASILCSPLNMCRFFSFAVKFPLYFLAFSYSLSNIVALILLFILFSKKVYLPKKELLIAVSKILIASCIMGISLYIPMKLLDQLVYDTSRTIGLIMLTGIASFVGFTSYIFFTWVLDIKEAYYIITVIQKFGDFRKVLRQVKELITGPSLNP